MPPRNGAPPVPPILVVSADPGLRRRCRSILRRAGLPAEAAPDGVAAFRRMAAAEPALVLLDWALPGVSARVVAAAGRAAFGTAVPLVLLAPAEVGPSLAEELGAAGWAREPVEAEGLLAAVRAALRAGRG